MIANNSDAQAPRYKADVSLPNNLARGALPLPKEFYKDVAAVISQSFSPSTFTNEGQSIRITKNVDPRITKKVKQICKQYLGNVHGNIIVRVSDTHPTTMNVNTIYEQPQQTASGSQAIKPGLSTYSSDTPLKLNPKKDYKSGDEQKYSPGQRLGEFVYYRDKKRGVEPGFEAYKWTKQNEETYLNDSKAIRVNKLKKPFTEEDKNKIRAYIIENVFLSDTNNTSHPIYYIKLDYDEPGLDGMVKIPIRRAVGGSDLVKKIHQQSTAETPRDKNFGAIAECMANDIFNALAFGGQELTLIRSEYADKSPKLLLAGKHVTGDAGEAFSTLAGQIHSGRITNNEVKQRKNGESSPLDTTLLGSAKIKSLLLADRDKIGSRGDNIGYVVSSITKKAVLKNIDPGKSNPNKPKISQDNAPLRPKTTRAAMIKYVFQKIFFEIKFFFVGLTDRMTISKINTDFSFQQPIRTIRDYFQKGYKNFDIFDDTLLSEKMKGMHDIINNWGRVEAVLDKYIQEFGNEPTGDPTMDALSFTQELQDTKARLILRKAAFERIFADRLKLNPNQLDMLDNLEKLTSRTTQTVKGSRKQGIIKLTHLRVIPTSRKEWSLDPDTKVFSYKFSSRKDGRKMLATLERLRKDFPGFEIKINTKKISFTAPPELIELLSDEENIRQFKHPNGFSIKRT